MRKYIIMAALVILGIIIAFPLFSIGYYTMVRTSTPGFCASCHEIQFAYNTWKTSTHVNNAQGFVADCMDCHLPAPHDTVNFFYTKTAHGIKDVYAHFTKDMSLYVRGLLDSARFFDERLEVEYYELWHHEGRRARMGTAMMAPDYAWWHGFYECKKRYSNFMEDARHLIDNNQKAYKATDFPNATGTTVRPKQVFPKDN